MSYELSRVNINKENEACAGVNINSSIVLSAFYDSKNNQRPISNTFRQCYEIHQHQVQVIKVT